MRKKEAVICTVPKAVLLMEKPVLVDHFTRVTNANTVRQMNMYILVKVEWNLTKLSMELSVVSKLKSYTE